MNAGQRALIRIPRASSCGATLRTKPTTACFVAAYTGSSGAPIEPGERGGGDDRAAVRHQPRGELAHAENDAVDVDPHDPPVLLVRQRGDVRLAGDDACVEERGVESALERTPRGRLADVVAVREVEHRHVRVAERRDDRRVRCRTGLR